MKYVVFMCSTIKILISNWPQTRKYFAHHCHALVSLYVQLYTLIGQNLTGELMWKIYAASWIFFYFHSWGWQSFVSTWDVFNCLFPLDVQNEIQLLSGVFCYPWSRVCLMGFWLRNTSLGKVGNSPCLMRKQSGISLNLRTGSTAHATLFNQWGGALVFIKTSTQWSKLFTPVDRVGQILR